MSFLDRALDGLSALTTPSKEVFALKKLSDELKRTKEERARYKAAYESLRDMIRDIKIHEI